MEILMLFLKLGGWQAIKLLPSTQVHNNRPLNTHTHTHTHTYIYIYIYIYIVTAIMMLYKKRKL